MRTTLALVLFATAGGCSAQLYGTGTLYVWNGTDQAVEVHVEGRTTTDVAVRPQSGTAVREIVAGPYQLLVKRGAAVAGVVGTEVTAERLTVFNVDAAGCFARVDIAGMYSRGKPPVELKQVYPKDAVLSIPEEIGVLPGERPPTTRPRSGFGFFRVIVVPCDIVNDDWKVEDFAKNLK
ncbi:MAG: hypothetical protein HY903_22155 [Deltaproteobacteria bacterium]|nr:hypothetical protein [Deltaproteobacteria bacterium]